jgi:hypothetical protein
MNRWYYEHDGRPGGPVTVAQLKQLAAGGGLLPTDRVRREDMAQWVKARAVKGLFTPAAAPEDIPLATPVEGDIGESGSVFDFLGPGPAPAEPAPAPEINPAFDFLGTGAAAPPSVPPPKPAARKSKPPAPPPAKPPATGKPVAPPPPAPASPVTFEPFPAAAPAGSGSFRFATPAAPAGAVIEEPIPFAEFQAEAPPPARPSTVGGLGPAELAGAVLAEVTGPAVELLPDELAAPTGGMVVLQLTPDWLAARAVAPDGLSRETYLRLGRLEAATLGGRRKVRAGRETYTVLSFHAGGQTVAVLCEGDPGPYRTFLQRVLALAKG